MNLRLLLSISVLANLGLVGALLFRASEVHDLGKLGPGTLTSTPTQAVATNSGHASKKPITVEGRDTNSGRFDWRSVESEDYKQYIGNLRSIGCPEKTIQDIITADVSELFASKQRASAASGKRYEYWKTGGAIMGMPDEAQMRKAQELNQEKRAMLKELLGVEPEQKLEDLLGGFNPFDTVLDFVPSAKRTSLIEIEQRYGMQQAKVMGGGGVPDADDLAKLKKIMMEKESELAKTLTPEELEQYQLRMSQTAMVMKSQLAGFDPSEKEFKDIFALKKKFDDEFGGNFGFIAGTASAERQAAENRLNQQIKETLGDQRYSEYQRGQDYAYQEMSRVADKQGLDREAANKAYEIKRIAEEQAARLRNDQTLQEAQRQKAMSAIYTETSKALTEALGEKGFSSLEGQPGAYWLKNLKGGPAPRIVQEVPTGAAGGIPASTAPGPTAVGSDRVE